ncbi:unnamed protein product [Adineta ricciae]|uniref:BTB domain-containing protein n=2 Tax=Adineta ricciae TaxID=249248 RepID=A0A813TSJ6_ADIRI|nr:unnamed protein product [Adineta ricciae]
MIRRRVSTRRQQEIVMSTWQQHALANTTLLNNSSQIVNNPNTHSRTNSVEVHDNLGEINHTSTLSGDFENLFNKSDYSDIVLIVEYEQFYAHRIVLAARSEYFRALLYGGLRESQHTHSSIEIKECKSAAFRILLLYIYTGRINLLKEKVDRMHL